MKSLKYTVNVNIENLNEKEVKDIIQVLDKVIDIFFEIRKECYPLLEEYVVTSQVVEL